MSKQQRPATKASGGKRSLRPGMAAANHNHIEFGWKLHEGTALRGE